MEEMRSESHNPLTWAAICDGCGKKCWKRDDQGKPVKDEEGKSILIGTHLWSCERKSVVHNLGITVCEDCMSGNTSIPVDPPCLSGLSFR